MVGRNVIVAMCNHREALSAKYVLASICWGIALIRMENMLGVAACAFNPSTGKAGAGWFLWVPGQLELHNEKLSQAKQMKSNHKKWRGGSLRNLGWHLLYPSILNYLKVFFCRAGSLDILLSLYIWVTSLSLLVLSHGSNSGPCTC